MTINITNQDSAKSSKGYKGIGMEGPIAKWYAQTTLKDLKRHKRMASQLAEKIPANGRVLEIAPGPGYFCIELAKLGNYQITGLDISKSFVEMARRNTAEAGLKIDFREGNASAMPFANETFDFTFCQAAFKNFSEPIKAIAEMHRALKPGRQALIVDLRRDASKEEIDAEVKQMNLNRINSLMTKWAFHLMLLRKAYTQAEIRQLVAQTDFHSCDIRLDPIGMAIWLTK